MEGNSLKHIAIIMDGNGRWGKGKGLNRVFGHESGVQSVKKVVEACLDKKIPNLTLFAFSSENWARPEKEVLFLMGLFSGVVDKMIQKIADKGIRLDFLGDLSALDEGLQKRFHLAKEKTAHNTNLNLNIAVNYGGRWDIVTAAKQLAEQYKSGEVSDLSQLGEDEFSQYLSSKRLPDPDLLIRTGGEERVSNFLLWQMAYSEIYFTETLWPDFDEEHLESAIHWFNEKQRRYGQTGEQVHNIS